MAQRHQLKALIQHIKLFQEIGYLDDYIETLVHDAHIKLETINDLVDCFDNELFEIVQNSL